MNVSDPRFTDSTGLTFSVVVDGHLVTGCKAISGLGIHDAVVAAGLTIAPMPIDLVAYVAEASWLREVGGITIGGLNVSTDDRSKIMIHGARTKADADPTFTTLWEGRYPIASATIIAISDAVLAHVDACFKKRGELYAAIEAGTITTTEQIDAAFAAI